MEKQKSITFPGEGVQLEIDFDQKKKEKESKEVIDLNSKEWKELYKDDHLDQYRSYCK